MIRKLFRNTCAFAALTVAATVASSQAGPAPAWPSKPVKLIVAAERQAGVVVGGKPEVLRDFQAAETLKWREMIKRAGIKAE